MDVLWKKAFGKEQGKNEQRDEVAVGAWIQTSPVHTFQISPAHTEQPTAPLKIEPCKAQRS